MNFGLRIYEWGMKEFAKKLIIQQVPDENFA